MSTLIIWSGIDDGKEGGEFRKKKEFQRLADISLL